MTTVDACAADAVGDEVVVGLVPSLIALDLPAGPDEAARALGVQPAAFVPMPDGALQAEFALPERSYWRIWPQWRLAIWIGTGAATSQPPVRWAWRSPTIALPAGLAALARGGEWLQEARLLTSRGWTDPLPGAAIPSMLSEVTAIAGRWSSLDGRGIRAVVFDDGRLWAETPQQAERWLLAVAENIP